MKRIALFLLPLFFFACGNGETDTMKFTGIIDANTVRVSAESTGKITALHFDEGVVVDSGMALITIESDRMQYQLSAQEAGVDELQHTYQAAEDELQAARLQRDNLKQKYERFLALLKEHAVTQQNVDDMKTQLDAANNQLDAAKKKLTALMSRKAQLLNTMKVTQDQISRTDVASPLAGTVLVRYVERGELVMPGTPVCEIADMQNLWTKIYISETELPNIALGSAVSVHIDGRETPLNGTMSWISSESEFTPKTILTEETRTTLVYAAKVRVENPDGILKIGMPVSVTAQRSR